MSNMIPVFTLKLNHKIKPRLVTVGKYDGKHPCLTAATNGNKVFIHSPHGNLSSSSLPSTRISSVESDISLLHFGQHITSLCAGNLGSGTGDVDVANNEGGANNEDRDVLLIGSQTHILAYDVDRNMDLFYNEVNDGATAIVVGNHIHDPEATPLAYVGGSCSVTGYNGQGEEKFWTVTGDNVHSMTLCDFDIDGKDELLVGSEDFDIRVFQGDDMISEVSEAAAITSLCLLGRGRYGYALLDGIVGVYSGETRLWRAKSKHTPMCISSYDYTGDGVLELVVGWSSGKVDIRHQETGEVICKTMFGSHIAGIVKADYRLDGKEELICCSVDGEVRGFLPPSSLPSPVEGISPDMLQDLNKRKSNLLLELRNFEVSRTVGRSQNPQLEMSKLGDNIGAIPAATQIRTELKAIAKDSGNAQVEPHISLVVETTNKVPIKAVVVFSDGLFEGESCIVHPSNERHNHVVEVPIYPGKDILYNMNISAFVGKQGSSHFHVLESSQSLPRFSLYVPCPLNIEPRPNGHIVFNINERLERLKTWINNNFLYKISEETATQSTYLLEACYMSLRVGSPFTIKIEQDKGSKVTITTDDMDLAGDLIQGMAEDFEVEDLTCLADFPNHIEDLQNIMTKVQEYHKVRESLSVDIADNTGMIRNLVVRAEDARVMEEMKSMRLAYTQLYELNKDIMRGYEMRRNNHMELLECLRIVNQAIQRGARLRVGKPKTVCTNVCRKAVKEMDHALLARGILTGQ